MNHNETNRSTLKLIHGTLISKVFGFLREVIIAAKFGATAVSDAFFLALQIPVLFRRILGEEMFEKTIMPVFVNKLSKDRNNAWRFISTLFWYSVLLSVLTVAFLYALKKPLIGLIAPGITDPETVLLINRMATYIIPYLILTTVYSFLGTIFNFTKRQFIFSVAPAVSNIAIIALILLFYPYIEELSLPVGFLLGGVFYIIFLIPFFMTRRYREDYLPRLSFSLRRPSAEIKTVSSESFWVFMQAILNKSVELVDRIIASFLITGSISGLWYAKRLEQLPSSIISMSISRAILSNLSDHHARENYHDFGETIVYGIKLCISVITPVTVLLCLLGKPVSIFIFKRGEFSEAAADMTSQAFIAYGIGFLAVAFYNLFSRTYSVLAKNRFTAVIMLFASLMNVLLSILLAQTFLKLAGIALASSVSFYFASIILFIQLKKELRAIGYTIDLKKLGFFAFKIAASCSLMGIIVFYSFRIMQRHLYISLSLLYFDIGLLIIITASAVSGLTAFILLCWFFDIRIIKNLFNILKKN